MTLVFDATPLIYLGKTDRLDILAGFEQRLVVPELVYEEVVSDGLESEHVDAKRVDKRCRDGPFEKQTVEADERFDRLSRNTRLSPADVSVLLLAEQTDGVAVMDERHGRDIADIEGIETRGTAYLVLSQVKRGELPADEAREAIDAMLDTGWHCSPDLYAKIIGKLDELRQA